MTDNIIDKSMDPDRPGDRRSMWIVFEGALLIFAAPFFLFPTILPWISVLFVILLLLFYLLQRVLTGQRLLLQTPFSAAMGVWLAAVVIAVLVSNNLVLSFPRFTGLLLGFAAWRYLTSTIRSQRAIYMGTTVLCLVGIGLVIVGVFSADWRFEAPVVERIFSVLPPQLLLLPEAPAAGTHTNQVAGTIVVFLPLFFSAIIGWRSERWRKGILSGIVVLTIVWIALLVLTQSRTAWLAALGGTFAFLLLWALTMPNSRVRWILWLILGLGIGLVLLTMIAIDINVEEVWNEPPTETALGTLSTIESRKEMWRWAVTAIHDFPFTGPGLGTYREFVHRWYPYAIPRSQTSHAHNIFLQVAVDTGLLGLTAYLAIVGIAFYLAWQVARRYPAQRTLAIGLFASLLTIHIFGLTDALAPGSKPAIIFWMLLGLIGAQWQLMTVGSATLPEGQN